VISMFILLCEFFVVLKYDEMNWNIVSRVFYNTLWNNLEYGVLMNYRVKCVENQVRNC
jgi:hypothetical protein